jgi:cbb3-type cytochrome oxidase cytochrome c subunit
MKTGFSVFLVSFVALGASWFGFVYGPVRQLGDETQTPILQSPDAWPPRPAGDATLGLQVYRACGCAACHTEQVRQTGTLNELTLLSLGVHSAGDFKDFIRSLMVVPELMNESNTIVGNLEKWNGATPFVMYSGDDDIAVSTLASKLKAVGVKTDARIVPTGPDIARGWGARQSVAEDFLYDDPVQPGNLRAGPDLAAIGVRDPDVNWQLRHLYAPRSLLKTSTMPPFQFLFEVRKVNGQPSPEALVLPKEFVPADGMEVVPTAEARQLAAYLVSLKANVPLYDAPFTPVTAAKP